MDKIEFYDMMRERAKFHQSEALYKFYEEKRRRAVAERREKILQRVLLGLVVVAVISPFINWFLFYR